MGTNKSHVEDIQENVSTVPDEDYQTSITIGMLPEEDTIGEINFLMSIVCARSVLILLTKKTKLNGWRYLMEKLFDKTTSGSK